MAEQTERSILSLVTANRLVKTKRNLCEINIETKQQQKIVAPCVSKRLPPLNLFDGMELNFVCRNSQ
jgi:hypothetical protein